MPIRGAYSPGRPWVTLEHVGERVLVRATTRKAFGRAAQKLRAQDIIPAQIQGDRLPVRNLQIERKELIGPEQREGFTRRLLQLETDEESLLALPQKVVKTLRYNVLEHVRFLRWPRDPENNPIKVFLPLEAVNDQKMPIVKQGAYVHDVFNHHGLQCWVRTPDLASHRASLHTAPPSTPRLPSHQVRTPDFPITISVDMDLADKNGDVRWEQMKHTLPPGVEPVRGPHMQGNFLLMRPIRIRA